MRLQLFKTNTGEAALIVNGHFIVDGDSEDDSARLVEQTGERLATALDVALTVQNVQPNRTNWEWLDLLLEQDREPDVCHKYGSRLQGGICVDETCPYSDWPQQVSLEDVENLSEDQVVDKYGLVRAEVHSDDRVFEASFFANQWFIEAADDRILALAYDGEWGRCYEADSVAESADHVPAVAKVFEYLNIIKLSQRETVGFECTINRADAMRWLQRHRHGLWCQIICYKNDVRIVEAQEPEVAGMFDWLDESGNACEMSFDSADLAAMNAVQQLGFGDSNLSVLPLYEAFWDSRTFSTPTSRGDFRILGTAMFCDALGYTKEDSEEISRLLPGQTWAGRDYGEAHTVKRIS